METSPTFHAGMAGLLLIAALSAIAIGEPSYGSGLMIAMVYCIGRALFHAR